MTTLRIVYLLDLKKIEQDCGDKEANAHVVHHGIFRPRGDKQGANASHRHQDANDPPSQISRHRNLSHLQAPFRRSFVADSMRFRKPLTAHRLPAAKRQAKSKGRSLRSGFDQGDVTSVCRQDLAADDETQAGAMVARCRGERLE
jgi:hypothetical protein